MLYQLLLLVIIFCTLENSLACQSNSQWPGDGATANGEEDPRFSGNLSDPSIHSQHWPPSFGVDVNKYIEEWKAKEKQKERDEIAANGGKVKEYPDDAGRDWPSHWRGLGFGNGGVPPPPWAKDPKGRGRADICYLSPTTGPCTKYKIRWGYNPYSGKCAEFVYSGCGGNMNNFFTKQRCREACEGSPKKQCQDDRGTKYSDYSLWN